MALCQCLCIAQAQEANPFGKALVPDMIADASIILVDGTFYCYATTDGYGRGLETSGPPTVWKSHDFVHWSFEGNYFPSAAEQKYWAPSKAIAANGKWYIYPTINGHMYAAEADSPEGPFRLVRGDDKFVLPTAMSLPCCRAPTATASTRRCSSMMMVAPMSSGADVKWRAWLPTW